jgi:hypothetical protein
MPALVNADTTAESLLTISNHTARFIPRSWSVTAGPRADGLIETVTLPPVTVTVVCEMEFTVPAGGVTVRV